MGIHRENGYSASVEAFFVLDDARFRVAKTNHMSFCLAEPCELAPGTTGSLLVIIDGDSDATQVKLPDGVRSGQIEVRYEVEAPF